MPTILLIDDELAIRKYMATLLSQLGYSIRTADDGNTGCEMAGDPEIKLVIADLNMPGEISGMDIVRKIRAMRPDCPIIVVSGYPTPDRLKETDENGIEFLTKPFEIPFLASILKRLLPPDPGSGPKAPVPK